MKLVEISPDRYSTLRFFAVKAYIRVSLKMYGIIYERCVFPTHRCPGVGRSPVGESVVMHTTVHAVFAE